MTNPFMQEMLRKLKPTGARALTVGHPVHRGGGHHHRGHFHDGSLVLDRDLIDLTMIPPPMTWFLRTP